MSSRICRCTNCDRMVDDHTRTSCRNCLTNFEVVPPTWVVTSDAAQASDESPEVDDDAGQPSGPAAKSVSADASGGEQGDQPRDAERARSQTPSSSSSGSCSAVNCEGRVVHGKCEICDSRTHALLELPWKRERYRLTAGQSVVFGRKEGDFARELRDYLNVSRKHCTISLAEKLTVTDHESLNGTYVDDRRIAGGLAFELRSGMTLRLGRNNQLKRLNAIVIRVVE